MKRIFPILFVLLLVLVVVLVVLLPERRTPPTVPDQGTAKTFDVSDRSDESPSGEAPRPPAYDPALDQLNRADRTVQDDLRLIAGLFDRYRLIVKDPSGNPGGTHEEIIAALQGRNRTRLAFLPDRHPALNAQNELVDRWGTPYFFHALSSTLMEIRSAGPDRRMWTDDDVRHPNPPTRDAKISTPAN
ncbi:MAG TPA: hypothetical protein PKE12_01760 [Kiritimatiellia bacterium]|nr:hypothetical protein [Kiritimatiellia bacterium]